MVAPPNKPVGSPDRDQFAALLIEGIRGGGETDKVIYDRERFLIHLENENDGVKLFLDNAHREYCSASERERPHVLNRWIRQWLLGRVRRVPEDFEDVRMDLLPCVRSRSGFGLEELRARCDGQQGGGFPCEVLAGDLGVYLAYDLPDSIMLAPQGTLDDWGVTLEQALEVARRNLSELRCNFVRRREAKGLYSSETRDNYDSSRVLLLDRIRGLEVRGDLIAMVPHRDMLLVTGSDDTDGLEAMFALAKNALAEPRSISATAFRLEGERWAPWLPPENHPLCEDFRTLWLTSCSADYASQKEMLDQIHEKAGIDIFVASLVGLKAPESNRLVSGCTWTEHAESLLPRAEVVVFVRGQSVASIVPWDRVVQVCGHLMEPVDIYPERYHVKDFPTERQLRAMGGVGT